MIATVAAATGNPFPGLRPFKESEQHLFFGRETKIDRMIDKLADQHFLAVVGSSGTGKSSLVNCGLKPALRRGLLGLAGTSWLMAQFRPGANPTRAMALALAQDAGLFSQVAEAGLLPADIIEANLRLSGVGLVDIYKQADIDKDINLLVVVDQFEELFRYRSLSSSDAYAFGPEAIRFVRLLLEAASRRDFPIYVVITMRSDFLGDCAHFEGLPEAINDSQYLVPRMTREERRVAIEGPIGIAECTISTALLTQLMNDVGDNPDQLSILQHALNRTWAHWRNEGKGEGAVALDDYEAVGTMAKALDQHAEKAFNEITPGRQKNICQRIFKAITDRGTDPRGVRRPTKLSTLCEITGARPAEIEETIAPFRKPSRSFLVPEYSEKLGPDSVIDISHESLMRVWNRLRIWADEEAEAAREYRRLSDRAEGYFAKRFGLMQDPDLQTALDFQTRQQPTAAWAEIYGGGFDRAIQFLNLSKQHRDLERAERELDSRWNAFWQPLIFGIFALGFLIVLFKYRASLLPSSADLSSEVKLTWDLVMHFSELSGVTLAFAVIYNLTVRLGQKLYRRYALAPILKAIQNPIAPTSRVAKQTLDPAVRMSSTYAPWWRRFLALVIDCLAESGLCIFPSAGIYEGLVAWVYPKEPSNGHILLIYPIMLVAVCAYHVLLVGSPWQATFGMLAMRIYVTDLNGHRLTRLSVLKRQMIKLLVYGSSFFWLLPLEALVRAALALLVNSLYQKLPQLKRGQWLADMASGTVVMVRKRR